MQMLEQIIQTAEQRLDGAAEAHLVVPAIAHRLQGDGVDVVRDEGAVGARGVAEPLAQHPAQHRLEALLVRVVVVPHALQRAADAHLAACDGDGCVEEIEVGELAVHAVVHDVQFVVAVAPWSGRVIHCDGAL